MKLYKFVLFLCFVSINNIYGNVWLRTCGGSENDCGYSICLNSDGNYTVAGYTESYGAGMMDGWLVKADSIGIPIWEKTFGNADSDCIYSVYKTLDNGYILAGYTQSFGTAKNSGWFIKTDITGDTLWTKIYGDSDSSDYCIYSVAQTADSGYIAVGTKNYITALMIKLDQDGNISWEQAFENFGIARDVKNTRDSGYIITGYGYSPGGWLIKTNINGDTLWTRTFSIAGNDSLFSVMEMKDSGYMATGGKSGSPLVVNVNSSGNVLFCNELSLFYIPGISSISNISGYDIIENTNGGYTIAIGGNYSAIIKPEYTCSGFYSMFNGNNNDYAYSVLQTPDSSYVITGCTNSFGEGKKDMWIIGGFKDSDMNYYCPAVEELSSNTELQLSVFPNPVIFFAKVSFCCNAGEKIKLNLYDMTGKKLMSLFTGSAANKNTVTLNTKLLATGKYFLKLETEHKNITKGIIIMR
ncbi:MAG: T9SS type A sorting domain-containing protein [bacterium]|nr:T9SS type A sorting domain-containing protein [bacterium]